MIVVYIWCGNWFVQSVLLLLSTGCHPVSVVGMVSVALNRLGTDKHLKCLTVSTVTQYITCALISTKFDLQVKSIIFC